MISCSLPLAFLLLTKYSFAWTFVPSSAPYCIIPKKPLRSTTCQQLALVKKLDNSCDVINFISVQLFDMGRRLKRSRRQLLSLLPNEALSRLMANEGGRGIQSSAWVRPQISCWNLTNLSNKIHSVLIKAVLGIIRRWGRHLYTAPLLLPQNKTSIEPQLPQKWKSLPESRAAHWQVDREL